MTTKPIDTFILNSVDLFKVNPSQSVISITYQPPKEPTKKLGKITFKSNNPHLSTHHKFSTNKNKDISRVLNALGPNGVSIIPNNNPLLKTHLLKQENKINKKKKKKSKQQVVNHVTTGIATLLANDKIPEYKPISQKMQKNTTNSTSTTNTTTTNKDSKKKKNKNKNKR